MGSRWVPQVHRRRFSDPRHSGTSKIVVIITVALKMTTIITSRISTLPSKLVVIITVGLGWALSWARDGRHKFTVGAFRIRYSDHTPINGHDLFVPLRDLARIHRSPTHGHHHAFRLGHGGETQTNLDCKTTLRPGVKNQNLVLKRGFFT